MLQDAELFQPLRLLQRRRGKAGEREQEVAAVGIKPQVTVASLSRDLGVYAVLKAIEDTEGQILVGSSTEVFDIVPLENFLAMRETAMAYRF